MDFLGLNLLFVVTLVSLVSGGYIPPGPKYKCPTPAEIWPCLCLSSNDNGTNLKCEDVRKGYRYKSLLLKIGYLFCPVK
jgi:hypothetical protein